MMPTLLVSGKFLKGFPDFPERFRALGGEFNGNFVMNQLVWDSDRSHSRKDVSHQWMSRICEITRPHLSDVNSPTY